MVQPINNPTTQALTDQSNVANSSSTGLTWFGEDGVDFGDLLDAVNPLQHIPIVNTIYRELTGDDIAAAPRLAGGTIYGGVVGLAASAVNLGIEAYTGDDIGGHAWNMAFGDEDSGISPGNSDPTGMGEDTSLAQANTGNALPSASSAAMPEGFANLVQNAGWAAIGTPTEFVPGQGPVAINRPNAQVAAVDAATNPQQMASMPSSNPATTAAPLPEISPVAQTQMAQNIVTASRPIPLMFEPNSQLRNNTAPMASSGVSSTTAPEIASLAPSEPQETVSAPALPEAITATTSTTGITPLAAYQPDQATMALPPVPELPGFAAASGQNMAPLGASTPSQLAAAPIDTRSNPLTPPDVIESEQQTPIGNAETLNYDEFAPIVKPYSAGGIGLHDQAPGSIPQPGDIAKPAESIAQPATPLDEAATATKLMPDNFFTKTESRYNASHAPATNVQQNASNQVDANDYLMPDFKPDQVVNHSEALVSAGRPDLMLPEMMNDTNRSLLDVAQNQAAPAWAESAGSQFGNSGGNQGGLLATAIYRDQMNGSPRLYDQGNSTQHLKALYPGTM